MHNIFAHDFSVIYM